MRVKTKGFTLVEIMVVTGIVSLLASLAIPNIVRMRLNANESAAVGSLRTISSAMENYRAAQTPPSYSPDLPTLSNAVPAYIDSVLGGGAKQSYNFVLANVVGGETYTCTAAPQNPASGTRTFVVDQSGVITCNGIPIE